MFLSAAIALLAAPMQAQEEERPYFDKREQALMRLLTKLPQQAPPSPTNRFADDPKAARFGQTLFFDPGLSPSGTVSCATCHDPEKGWSDGRPTSLGVAVGRRNAPTLLGVAEQRWFFWDGRADSLWSQALGPIENPIEMASSRTDMVRYVAETPGLRKIYEELFGALPEGMEDRKRFPEGARPRPPAPTGMFHDISDLSMPAEGLPAYRAWASMSADDQEAVNRAFANCGKAIAAFERKLVVQPAPFDHFAASILTPGAECADKDAISIAAQRGLKLFMGKASCHNCHFTPLMSDREFHNVGHEVGVDEEFAHGRPDGIQKLRLDPFNGMGPYSDAPDLETNVKLRYLFYDSHTYGAYKTPTLRNLGRTAPYMHDGRFETIEEAVFFYQQLPGQPPIGHREETLTRPRMTLQERKDLAAFLRTLDSPPLPEELRRAPD